MSCHPDAINVAVFASSVCRGEGGSDDCDYNDDSLSGGVGKGGLVVVIVLKMMIITIIIIMKLMIMTMMMMMMMTTVLAVLMN